MSVGRPKDKSSVELDNLFQSYSVQFIRNGKLLPPKDQIWTVISEDLSVKKSSKAIYTAAGKWLK